jgi:ubiquinone/menaquinone biosynthesis C-methylase UbiE
LPSLLPAGSGKWIQDAPDGLPTTLCGNCPPLRYRKGLRRKEADVFKSIHCNNLVNRLWVCALTGEHPDSFSRKKRAMNSEHKFWDGFAGRYDRFMKRLSDEYATLIDLIWKEIKPEDEVLEIATGTGIIALEICKKVRKVYAADISEPMINIAREKADKAGARNIEFSIQSGYSLSFVDASCDVCIVANSLHVMKEPEKCLKEIRRVLRPQGLLIAPTFCHGETLKARIVSTIMGLYGFKAFHRFTIEDYSDLVESSGFHILKKQTLESVIPLEYIIAKPYGESRK